MIALDIRSLLLAAGLTALAVAATLFVVWRSREEPCLRHWIAAAVLVAAGIILIGLRDTIAPALSIVVANTCIAIGAGCAWTGMDSFLGRRPGWWLVGAIASAIFASFWYFTFPQPDTGIRIVLISLVYGGYAAAIAHRLLTDRAAADLGAARNFLVTIMLIAVLYLVARVALTLSGEPPDDYMNSGLAQALGPLVLIFFTITLNFGFFALVDQRHVNDLARARDEADLANTAKSEFLANMSHELRTPLNAVVGFSEIMESEILGPIPPKYREYAGDIRHSGSHLLALINDVLDLAKIDAGRLELRETEFDVGEPVRRAVTMTSVLARKNNVVVQPSIEQGLPRLFADQLRFEQVVLNLLSNAIKFAPFGQVRIEAKTEDGALVVRVTDNGPGMSEQEISIALTRFGQVNTTHVTRNIEGTGLGLPVAAAILRLHGGQLELQSKPGSGTTATLRFPRERARPLSQTD